MRLVSEWIGSQVVVRSGQSGVWLGELRDAEGDSVRLKGARRAWQWNGAGSCSALAATGPTGGKIAVPVDVVVHGCCEVLLATDEAVEAWLSITPWTGRE